MPGDSEMNDLNGTVLSTNPDTTHVSKHEEAITQSWTSPTTRTVHSQENERTTAATIDMDRLPNHNAESKKHVPEKYVLDDSRTKASKT